MVYWDKDIDKFFNIFVEFGAVVNLRPLQGKVIGEKNALRQPKLFDDI